MNSYIKICQMLYYLLFTVFCVFAIISWISGEKTIHEGTFLIFLVLCVPLIDVGLKLLDSEKTNFFMTKLGAWSHILRGVTILLIILCFFGKISFLMLLALSGVVFILKNWEGRLYFLFAMGAFLLSAFYMVFPSPQQSEFFAIQAYYLLIAGVIVQIAQSVLFSQKSTKDTLSPSSETTYEIA